jgi:UDP-2,3-diacylglucosamine pyrophosphatase LpxH
MNLRSKKIENLVFCGDIHGDVKTLGYQISELYKFQNTLIIALGDIGLGFQGLEYHKIEYKKLNTRIKKGGNHVVMFRGNHDDKSMFQSKELQFSNVHLCNDYDIIETSYKDRDNIVHHINILLVGGGLSIDREWRKQQEWRYGKKLYWEDEMPVYDAQKLDEVNRLYLNNIQIICSHTSPSWCFPVGKEALRSFATNDDKLMEDADLERMTMDRIFNHLKPNQSELKWWYYGHFHAFKRDIIEGVTYTLCDCNQLFEHI